MKKIVPLFTAVFLCGILFYMYSPRPIIHVIDNCSIQRIQLCINSKFVECEDYKENEVLQVLSNSYEQRTLERATSYANDDVQLSIVLMTENGFKQILLGNINYTYEGYNSSKYKICNSKDVINSLLKILRKDA